MIIDPLIGQNVLGESCYVQVKNIDGLLGKFNCIFTNKLLVNVDEVSTTQSQASDIKNVVPGETMMFKKKRIK